MSRRSRDFVWPMIGMMDGRSNFPTLLIGGENLDICSESLSFSSYCSRNIWSKGLLVSANTFSVNLSSAMKRKMSTGGRMFVVFAHRVDGLDTLADSSPHAEPANDLNVVDRDSLPSSNSSAELKWTGSNGGTSEASGSIQMKPRIRIFSE